MFCFPIKISTGFWRSIACAVEAGMCESLHHMGWVCAPPPPSRRIVSYFVIFFLHCSFGSVLTSLVQTQGIQSSPCRAVACCWKSLKTMAMREYPPPSPRFLYFASLHLLSLNRLLLPVPRPLPCYFLALQALWQKYGPIGAMALAVVFILWWKFF